MRPMLAATVKDVSKLQYPLGATPKIDGIRCLVVDGKAVSRAFKPIQNHHIRQLVEEHCITGCDGELVVPGAQFNETASAVMSRDGKPDFEYHVFDRFDVDGGYRERVQSLGRAVGWIRPVLPLALYNEHELLKYEETCLEDGYEGVMLRSLDSPYKHGRSTLREGWLMKLKRFHDGEATIVGFQEQLQNNNAPTEDAFGYTKRPGGKANSTGKDTLGKLIVVETVTKVEFKLGSGFDDALRLKIWNNQQEYLGRTVHYRCQMFGAVNSPRFPRFIAFREDL